MTGEQSDQAVAEATSRWLPVAQSASANAYSPYSSVRVGAVVVGSDGRAWAGCNVENASYGLTQCAERNALAAAIADGVKPGELHTLLVYAEGFGSLTPCGACRQVMSELLAADATVISCCTGEPDRVWRLPQLLPDPFSLA